MVAGEEIIEVLQRREQLMHVVDSVSLASVVTSSCLQSMLEFKKGCAPTFFCVFPVSCQDSSQRPPNKSTATMSDIARRLDLLGAVLPSFKDHVKSITERLSKGSEMWIAHMELYMALSELIVPVRELKKRFSERDFSTAERECANLIKQVLSLLERWSAVSSGVLQNAASPATVLAYPSLQRIRADCTLHTLHHQSVQVCQSMQSAIDRVTKSYDRLCARVGYPEPIERLAESTTPWNLREHLQILHDTLGKFWSCDCQDPHEGMLFLATHRPHDMGGGAEFDLLFGSTQLSAWNEAQVFVSNPSTEYSRVGFEPYKLPRRKRNVEHVCRTIHKILPNSCLKLIVNDRSLYETQSRSAVLKIANLVPSATLLDVLSGPTLNFECKIKFAVILAYNFLYLCGSPWLPSPWDKRAIRFLGSDQSLVFGEILRPLLAANYSLAPTPDPLPEGLFHKDQARLALGILLLEVFEQQAIEELRVEAEDYADSDIDANLFTAARVFEKIDWDVHEKYAEAVSACLDDAEIDGKPWGDDAHCQYIYTRVVKPLEQELEDYCDISIDDLDKLTRGTARAVEAATSNCLQTSSPARGPPAQANTTSSNDTSFNITRAESQCETVLEALTPLSLYHIRPCNENR
jgi:hypothetical protein